jgi:hypothetical protein
MVLTKALEAYSKYFRMILAIVLPVGIVIGSILCGVSNLEYHKLDYLLVFNVPGWLLSPLWIGALIYSLSRLELSQEITYANAINHGLKTWWKLAIIGIITITFNSLRLFIGSNSYILSWLYYLIIIFIVMRYIFILPVLTLESAGAIGSIRRSAELSQGKRLSMFFELLAMGVLLNVVKFLLTMLLGWVGNLLQAIWITQVYFIVILGIIEPVITSLIIVWIYYYYLEQSKSMIQHTNEQIET